MDSRGAMLNPPPRCVSQLYLTMGASDLVGPVTTDFPVDIFMRYNWRASCTFTMGASDLVGPMTTDLPVDAFMRYNWLRSRL